MPYECYACYERVNGIPADMPIAINLKLVNSVEKAADWFIDRITKGTNANYIVDREDPIIDEDKSVDKKALSDEIEHGYASLSMFYKRHKNWNDSYDIVVIRKKID